MAQVFRTKLNYFNTDGLSLIRETGTAVMVEGEKFVAQYDAMLLTRMGSDWCPSQREADLAALVHLDRYRNQVESLISSITADPGRSGCHSSATG